MNIEIYSVSKIAFSRSGLFIAIIKYFSYFFYLQFKVTLMCAPRIIGGATTQEVNENEDIIRSFLYD